MFFAVHRKRALERLAERFLATDQAHHEPATARTTQEPVTESRTSLVEAIRQIPAGIASVSQFASVLQALRIVWAVREPRVAAEDARFSRSRARPAE